jgi:hypothetical protein
VKYVGGLFPAGTDVVSDIGTTGNSDDFQLNRSLVEKYHPDSMVVMTLDVHTESKSSWLVLSKTQFQFDVRIDFMAPDTLDVIASKTVKTDIFPAKGMGESLPPGLKDQLAQRINKEVTSLP